MCFRSCNAVIINKIERSNLNRALQRWGQRLWVVADVRAQPLPHGALVHVLCRSLLSPHPCHGRREQGGRQWQQQKTYFWKAKEFTISMRGQFIRPWCYWLRKAFKNLGTSNISKLNGDLKYLLMGYFHIDIWIKYLIFWPVPKRVGESL